jgi:hypothetical protein
MSTSALAPSNQIPALAPTTAQALYHLSQSGHRLLPKLLEKHNKQDSIIGILTGNAGALINNKEQVTPDGILITSNANSKTRKNKQKGI